MRSSEVLSQSTYYPDNMLEYHLVTLRKYICSMAVAALTTGRSKE